jgi:hypothetical protein
MTLLLLLALAYLAVVVAGSLMLLGGIGLFLDRFTRR